MQKLLEINNISKTFNTLNGEINAIKSISFDVNKITVDGVYRGKDYVVFAEGDM